MRTAFLVVLALAAPAAASADAITPEIAARLGPPASCPAGAEGVRGHHGATGHAPHCRPTTCTAEGACLPGTGPCEEIALCIRHEVIYGVQTPEGAPMTRPVVTGACGAGATCTEGTCETAMRCAGREPGPDPEPGPPPDQRTGVDPVADAPAASSRGCACTTPGPRRHGILASLLALALAAAWLAHRAR